MATEKTKAKNALAQFNALSNAAEMIGSHGEEGFSFQDNEFNQAYLKAAKRVKKSLMLKADKALEIYKSIGIEIDDSIHDDAGYID